MKNRIIISTLTIALAGCGGAQSELGDNAGNNNPTNSGSSTTVSMAGAKSLFIAKSGSTAEPMAMVFAAMAEQTELFMIDENNEVKKVEFQDDEGNKKNRKVKTNRKVGKNKILVESEEAAQDIVEIIDTETDNVFDASIYDTQYAQIKGDWLFAFKKDDDTKLYRVNMTTNEEILVNDYDDSVILWGQTESERYAIQAGEHMYTTLFPGVGNNSLAGGTNKLSFLVDEHMNVMTTEPGGYHNFYIVFLSNGDKVEHWDFMGDPNNNAINHNFYMNDGRLVTVMLNPTMGGGGPRELIAETVQFSDQMHAGLVRTNLFEPVSLPACTRVLTTVRYTPHDSTRVILCTNYAVKFWENAEGGIDYQVINGDFSGLTDATVTGIHAYKQNGSDVYRTTIEDASETTLVASNVISWEATKGVLIYSTAEGTFTVDADAEEATEEEFFDVEQVVDVLETADEVQ